MHFVLLTCNLQRSVRSYAQAYLSLVLPGVELYLVTKKTNTETKSEGSLGSDLFRVSLSMKSEKNPQRAALHESRSVLLMTMAMATMAIATMAMATVTIVGSA